MDIVDLLDLIVDYPFPHPRESTSSPCFSLGIYNRSSPPGGQPTIIDDPYPYHRDSIQCQSFTCCIQSIIYMLIIRDSIQGHVVSAPSILSLRPCQGLIGHGRRSLCSSLYQHSEHIQSHRFTIYLLVNDQRDSIYNSCNRIALA
jgi:hypothetical protein